MPERERLLGNCGVCGRLTSDGEWLESGPKNRRTRHTPCDNFICRRCLREQRDSSLMGAALDEFEKRRSA